ncbi:hypothetical protein DAEQUDRAFT_430065 [Daedalea quercina L-15889]|uniref:Mitochondrial chaperone BCS1-like ATPase lid domain-containing protein n=1 Tax=Daedalea quercina L-15889 TaxID=1314783 RepID=A0A165NFA5_9APHY|nr:hypothetical protein DAEQUDRAFT_430065 [Daedalea quercina L-15889]
MGAMLPRNIATQLAKQLCEAIPDRELSVAALQCYLMAYKVRPFGAVHDAPGWVSKIRGEKGRESQLEGTTE